VELDVIPDAWKGGMRDGAALWRVLRKWRPEILHLHFTSFVSPHAWLARMGGVRSVFFSDQASRPEGYVAGSAPAWKRLAVRLINWPIDRVISGSDYGANCFRALGVLPAERFTRIYNSVRLEDLPHRGPEFRRRFGIPEGCPLVTQVSALIPEKGFEDLLEAARMVVDQNPRAHFAMVGDGRCRAEYEQRTAALRLTEHVTWTGLVEDPLEAGVFDAADVTCQMSRWEELFGWVIAEAMAFSRPVIGTRAGAIPEVIEDGRTGYLVERRNPAAMAQRILECLADPELRERMGRAGRAAAEQKFDIRRNVAHLVSMYGIR